VPEYIRTLDSTAPEIIPEGYISAIYLRLYYEFKIIYSYLLKKSTRCEALR
jgi:hypothetical protein